MKNINLLYFMIIWFVSNYNFTIWNKKILDKYSNYSVIIGIMQLIIGNFIFIGNLIWKKKNLSFLNFKLLECVEISFFYFLCHIFSLFSTLTNSFLICQAIKSIEPVFNVILKHFYTFEKINKNKIISLFLIIIGSLVSIINITNKNKINFSCNITGLIYGIASNICCSMKSIKMNNYIKKYYNFKSNKNIPDEKYQEFIVNLYNFINLLSSLLGLIFILITRKNILMVFNEIAININLLKKIVLTGIFFYISNIYSTIINFHLSLYGQIALGLIKRILMIVISKIVFNEQINIFQLVGFVIITIGLIINYIK